MRIFKAYWLPQGLSHHEQKRMASADELMPHWKIALIRRADLIRSSAAVRPVA